MWLKNKPQYGNTPTEDERFSQVGFVMQWRRYGELFTDKKTVVCSADETKGGGGGFSPGPKPALGGPSSAIWFFMGGKRFGDRNLPSVDRGAW